MDSSEIPSSELTILYTFFFIQLWEFYGSHASNDIVQYEFFDGWRKIYNGRVNYACQLKDAGMRKEATPFEFYLGKSL